MLIKEMNWMQVEHYLKTDDRIVLPIGSTEQHAYLSLMTDTILAEKVATEAAEPLGVPVLPVVPYGLAPYFTAYPGTISLRSSTYFAMIVDILDSVYQAGFRRILLVNGHGGNSPVLNELQTWLNTHSDARVKLHNWWAAPKTMAKVKAIDAVASHASWMENFPWTRLAGVTLPDSQKPMISLEHMRQLSAQGVRDYVGDGNYGGDYYKDDALMQALWAIGVAETRAQLADNWA
ncbi:MAG: creatininase family protein [Neisseriaceae bacterium]|nr:creatininase family protein [Neisseriaceae bacterium]MBP6861174.1 creatininase family protein [Neisseriaceae bacterium]